VGSALAGTASGARPQLEPGYGTLTWAPGPAITFAAQSGGIYAVGPDGSGLRRLSPIRDASAWLRWSPDGRTLLVGTLGKIEVLRPGGRRRSYGTGFVPVWSPNGRWIAFSEHGFEVLSVATAHDEPQAVQAQADRSARRLHGRWHALEARGKPRTIVVVAAARELAGHCWALATIE
jgi:hypothetical protein